MASRKDFASKKNAAKKPAAKPRKAASTSSPSAKASAPVAKKKPPQPVAKKTPWKLIIASFVSVSVIGTIIYQLLQVDPKQIRETGMNALLAEKLGESNNQQSKPISSPPSTTNAAVDKPSRTVPTQPKAVTKPAAKPTPKPTAKPVVKPTAKPTEKTAGKVPVAEKSIQGTPKEPYQFYKILAETSVETETIEAYKSTPKTAKLKNRTLLQTGSFRNGRDAERMKARLLLNNLPKVTVSKTTSENGTWYRVRTGPFLTFNELKAALTKLNKLNISPIQIPLK